MMANPIKMLLIDLKQLTSELDRAGFKQMGIRVKQVEHFDEAKKTLMNLVGSAQQFDVIVINMDLDNFDAVAACRWVKQQKEMSSIPVILRSVQASMRKLAENASCNLFVEQPMPRHLFIEQIKKCLDLGARSTARIEIPLQATVLLEGRKIKCTVVDLSLTGVLLHTNEVFEINRNIEVLVSLDDKSHPLKISGQVVRQIPSPSKKVGQSYGVRFESMDEKNRRSIARYVAEHDEGEKSLLYYL